MDSTSISLKGTSGGPKKSFFDAKKGFSIYFKILINYTQMIAIIHSLDLKWPYQVDGYLNVSSQFGTSGEVISLECVLEDQRIRISPLHVKALLVILFPFVLMGFFTLVLSVSKILKKKKSKLNQIFIAFIVMSIFIQPTILQILFDNLNYTKLNGVSYLTKNLKIRADDEEHTRWV